MDRTFFAEYGITSTSANHIANVAKEMIQNIESELKNVSFVNISVSQLGSTEKSMLKVGVNEKELDGIQEKLETIGNVHSLIAWLREAIKAKENAQKEITNMNFEEWCGARLPKRPTNAPQMTIDDVVKTLSVGVRNKYLTLQAKAAVLGKYIHPDGELSKARKELNNRLKNPSEVVNSSNNTLVYSYAPSVFMYSDVEKLFFQLQNQHREIQAELNGINADIKRTLDNKNLEIMVWNAKAQREYNAKIEELRGEFDCWKETELAKVSSMKILIPINLKDIYNKVSNLGK